MFWLNPCKRFHTNGPHSILPGHHQQVICISLISDLNVTHVLLWHGCQIPKVLSTPVKVNELDLVICVEKNIRCLQITNDKSLSVQCGQNLLDLHMSILRWFELSCDMIHNNYIYGIPVKVRWGVLSKLGKIIGEPSLL